MGKLFSRGQHKKRGIIRGAALCVLVGLLAGCGPSVATLRTEPVVTLSPEARDSKVKEDLATLQQQVQAYYNRYEDLPDRQPALIETPDKQPLITELLRDPWRVPYMLRRINDDVIIFTSGPDLIIGSPDDVIMRMSFEGVSPQPSASPSATPESAS